MNTPQAQRWTTSIVARSYDEAEAKAREWLAERADPLRYNKPRRHCERGRGGVARYRFVWLKKSHAAKVHREEV